MSALRTFLGASIVVAIGCGGSTASEVGDGGPGTGDMTEDGSIGLSGDDGSVATEDSSTGTNDDSGPPGLNPPGANGDAGFRFPFPLPDGGFPRRGFPDGGLRPPRRGFDGGIGGFRDAGFPPRPTRDGGIRPPPPPIVDAGNEPG
jgi:hypothetical protein